MLRIAEEVNYAKYSGELEDAINFLGGTEILRLDFESDYQGHVDIDVLLDSGQVFSYYYSYGSCSQCDSWEAEGLTDSQIRKTMIDKATIFDNINNYLEWRKQIVKN